MTASDTKTVLITGATGFVGSALCRHFRDHGYQVRALVRNTQRAHSLEGVATGGIFHCDLPGDIDEQAFSGDVLAVIHCAYASQTTDKREAIAINIDGSRRVIELARKYHVHRFIFISSLSAHEEAASLYGQSKLEVERMLDIEQDLIIRSGMVIGKGGLFQRLQESLRRFPVVPLFYGGQQAIQIIWIENFCQAVSNAMKKELTGLYLVAHPEEVALKAFYKMLARGVGKTCHFVRLPGKSSAFLLRLCERLGLNLPVTADNLLGLKHMKIFDTGHDLAKLGIEAISLKEAMERLA